MLQGERPITFALLIVGLALLLCGGAAMVRGASGIAEGYGVPPLVVGLTVVAFGTSAPELVVNVLGAFQGQTELAFGNITGSNLANLGLVLGSAAIITPMSLQGKIIRRELPLLLLGSTVLLFMTLDPILRGELPVIDRSDGLIMLLLFGIFIYLTVADFVRQDHDPLVATIGGLDIVSHAEKRTNWLLVIGGIIGLAIGGQLTIDQGTNLAESMGVPPVLVGMLVLAVGTSLPELITSIFAAMRREADLCVGNVIGSNIFNGLFVLPISALVNPLMVPEGGGLDILVSLIFAALLIPIFIFGKGIMNRNFGLLFVGAYIGYMTFRVINA
ncbi:MAG: sodium:calcium antiporter [Pseudohongiella sp.]|nr:MAG: sodium:calcium antiporter [Pseudohongiella sp.]